MRAGKLMAAAVGEAACAIDQTISPTRSTFFGEPTAAAAPVGLHRGKGSSNLDPASSWSAAGKELARRGEAPEA